MFSSDAGWHSPHVSPLSVESVRHTQPSVARMKAWTPSSSSQSVGCMTPGGFFTSAATGGMGNSPDFRQLRPSSSEMSTKARHWNCRDHGLEGSNSRDAGASQRPFRSRRHLFLTGPRPPQTSPGTNSRGAHQVTPSSRLSCTYVRQSAQLRPTLKKSSMRPSSARRKTGFQCGETGLTFAKHRLTPHAPRRRSAP